MARPIRVAVLQLSFSDDEAADIGKVAEMTAQAASDGAQVILPPELFQGHYFCKTEKDELFARAHPLSVHPALEAMVRVAKERDVVIPVSLFERDGPHYYNTLVMVDAGGQIMGHYRKSHIPDGPGYEEKYYFRPGNTGFKVWKTAFGTIGVGICWDQWFPECARIMMLEGAEVLLYPTAIGSEPQDDSLDTKDPWQRAMTGHAASNVVPVVAANRTGTEDGQKFYGSSFIVNHRGDKVAEMGRDDEGILHAEFDLDDIARDRASFGFFRDRRPDLYQRLCEDR